MSNHQLNELIARLRLALIERLDAMPLPGSDLDKVLRDANSALMGPKS